MKQNSTCKTKIRKRKWVDKNIGDCCFVCGYNKCVSALELHHIKETNFIKSRRGKHRSGLCAMKWEDLYNDAPNMIRLCSNCHKEVHMGLHPDIPVPEHTTSMERQKGRAAYGYKWEEGYIVVDPDTYPIRKRIFDFHENGLGWSAISHILNEDDIPSQRGSKWFPTTVMRIVNPIYTKSSIPLTPEGLIG